MGVTLTDEHVQTVLTKLDAVRLELLRLRAILVPEGAVTPAEQREIRAARREYAQGKFVLRRQVLKELK